MVADLGEGQTLRLELENKGVAFFAGHEHLEKKPPWWAA